MNPIPTPQPQTDKSPAPSHSPCHHITTSPRLTRSQNLVSRHTLPTPQLSSRRRTLSPFSLTARSHCAPTQRRSPSLILSRSTRLFCCTSAGETIVVRVLILRLPLLSPSPELWSSSSGVGGRHSLGSTARSARVSGEGRAASRRARRIETRLLASRRDTTVVCVRKMERAMRSARDGREGDQRRGGRMIRVRCRR